jgi:hypothetical protein
MLVRSRPISLVKKPALIDLIRGSDGFMHCFTGINPQFTLENSVG